MNPARTHLSIDRRLSGEPIELDTGRARVALETVAEMAADEHGLVHGGFLFSLADHAAMLAVNDPNVVLAAGRMEFLGPLRVGQRIEAEATIVRSEGHRHEVEVEVALANVDGRTIARGRFDCVVTRRHVLETAPGAAEAPG